jgi:hypothetical protein
MRTTTTGRFRAEQPWGAADLPCQQLPELVPLLGMDRGVVSVRRIPQSVDGNPQTEQLYRA